MSRPAVLSHSPAQIMAQSGAARGAPAVLARAHHGSVSKEQRATIEEELKSGRLPAVVATSSLELGIDMGAVDLVVQVESPPSVASGLQRVGRAGHQVGAVSRGVLFPKFRGDLVQTAVVVERMLAGQIEALRVPANPLDVLAQHVVAMCALDEWSVDDVLTLARRAAPYATLTRPVLESVLDMLAGRYPSEEFAELRARSPGTASRTPSPAVAAPSASPSPPAAPSPTVACMPSSSRPATGPAAAWASSTRRWCTSHGSVTCSPSGRARGGSRTSPTTGSS